MLFIYSLTFDSLWFKKNKKNCEYMTKACAIFSSLEATTTTYDETNRAKMVHRAINMLVLSKHPDFI